MLQPLSEENARLEKLRSLNILDTKPEAEYDRITALAARRFKVPISLVSLVDQNRQWFKSNHGIDIKQVSRDASFSSEIIKNAETRVIHDSMTDDVFKKIATHPTYLQPLRFYVGVPLITKDGHTIGSFCIADYSANHTFSDDDQKDLEVMAEMIIKLIESDQDALSH